MDRVVYSESSQITKYIIQLQDENGDWVDSFAPEHRTLIAARHYLAGMTVTPYPYRIVERVN